MIGSAKVNIRQHNAMRAMRAQGMTLREIADQFPDISDIAVYHHVRDVPPPPGGWSKGGGPRKFDRKTALRLRDTGLSYAKIAKRLGVAPATVWFAIRDERKGLAA